MGAASSFSPDQDGLFAAAHLFQLSLDGSWDEAGWSRLRSFLYYC